jgi:hypothetical protein
MTDTWRSLAFALAAVLAAAPSALVAQRTGRATVSAHAVVRAVPGGRALALAYPGAHVATRGTRSAATQVVLDGYVHTSVLAGKRDSFAVSIDAPSGALLRATPAPKGTVIARLDHWMGLHELGRKGEWVHVQRAAWIANGLLDAPPVARTEPRRSDVTRVATTASAVRTGEGPASATDSSAGAVEDSVPQRSTTTVLTPTSSTAFAAGPEGRPLGTLSPGASLVPLARERGWVRVRVEGWVRESGLQLADSGLVSSLSAADLRADTAGTRGRVVRWQVEVLAFRRADALRRDLAPNEPYLLARGPGDERAMLYLALPPALVDDASALPALTQAIVTARVRTGRSDPSGVPILDVLSLARR